MRAGHLEQREECRLARCLPDEGDQRVACVLRVVAQAWRVYALAGALEGSPVDVIGNYTAFGDLLRAGTDAGAGGAAAS